MEGMTLQELLRSKGITKPAELAHVLGVDRRYAWRIWHGQRKIGARLALRLFEQLGIPVHEILRAEAAPEASPRGRPPKRPRPPEEEQQG
jgi:transcriptional regulator with XRE-family HTH domain